MSDRPIIDVEALAAALAERAREDAPAAGGAARAAGGGPAPAPAADPGPEEQLDYLSGRLDPERTRKVERRLVADPAAARALLDLAELEAAGREAAAAGGDRGAAEDRPPADLAVEAGWREFKGRLAAEPVPVRRSASRTPWLLAAALGVLALGLGVRVATLQQELGRPAALASFELHAGTRAGGAGPQELALPAGSWLELVVVPAEPCDGAPYRAVIEGPGAGDRHRIDDPPVSELGLIELVWRAEPGSYRLTLSGCEPRRELQRHEFRVVRPPPAGGEGGGG